MGKLTSEDKLMIGLIVFFAATFIPMMMFGGFVLSKLWLWFVVPATGLNPIGVANAIGLSFFVGYFKSDIVKDYSGEKNVVDAAAKDLMTAYLRPFWLLLIGWIIVSFM